MILMVIVMVVGAMVSMLLRRGMRVHPIEMLVHRFIDARSVLPYVCTLELGPWRSVLVAARVMSVIGMTHGLYVEVL